MEGPINQTNNSIVTGFINSFALGEENVFGLMVRRAMSENIVLARKRNPQKEPPLPR